MPRGTITSAAAVINATAAWVLVRAMHYLSLSSSPRMCPLTRFEQGKDRALGATSSSTSGCNSVGTVRMAANASGLNNLTGSDCSNSASSCNSCSTPGSPFQVDFVGGKYLQNNGNSFNLSHISSIDRPPAAPPNDPLPEDFQGESP
ncbi:hypothetical protein TSMEX_002254 [Taenia solium]|eukprot:TsM_000701400 transcript=TsM_000701400 gene=TsM_000701400